MFGFGWSVSGLINTIHRAAQEEARSQFLLYEARRQEAEHRRLAEEELYAGRTITVEYTRTK